MTEKQILKIKLNFKNVYINTTYIIIMSIVYVINKF